MPRAVNLSDEILRRKAAAERPTTPSAPAPQRGSGVDEQLLLEITDQILNDHFEVVHAVSAGQRDESVLARLVAEAAIARGVSLGRDVEETVQTVLDNILRYGPLQSLVSDPAVTDIFVNGPDTVYVRVNDQDVLCPNITFKDNEHLTQYIRAVLARVGARITNADCIADARDNRNNLRINAGIAPVATVPYLAIRKHLAAEYSTEDFLKSGTFTEEILDFLHKAVAARLNIVISGPTGSGKTTLLRFLANNFLPPTDRIVVLEEEAELRIRHPNQVALEAKRQVGEDDKAVTLNDLVRNALRMAPRRIILGELRGQEAFALLRAFGTGHDGGLTTVHANDIYNTIDQLAVMMLFAQTPLEYDHLCMLAADAIDLIVYVERRRVEEISWVSGYDSQRRQVVLEPIFLTQRNERGELVYERRPVSERVRNFFWRRGVRVE